MTQLRFAIALVIGCSGYPATAWDRPLREGECTRAMQFWVVPQKCLDGLGEQVRWQKEKSFSVGRPVRAQDWTKEAKLWTARSCVGEAGFGAIEECLAIAWVYATRVRGTRQSFVSVVRKYSAAVKDHERHRRPWIRQLNLDGTMPADWPQLNWGYHGRMWKKTLAELDAWARGKRPNPVVGANHYGSHRDAQRARYVRKWKRLKAPEHFKNWFFDSTIIDKGLEGAVDFGPAYRSRRDDYQEASHDNQSYGRLRRERL
jgi:hypothetical protein